MPKSPQTVIGIPCRWPNLSDIVTSIASRSGGYLFAGMAMMKIGAKDGFTLEIYKHDLNPKNAFSVAGRGQLTDADVPLQSGPRVGQRSRSSRLLTLGYGGATSYWHRGLRRKSRQRASLPNAAFILDRMPSTSATCVGR